MSGCAECMPPDIVVAEAMSWLGTPYRHQASRKGVGCDCLGLVRGVWRALYGREPEATPPYSKDWVETSGGEPLFEAARRHFIPCEDGKLEQARLILFRWRPHLPAKHAGIMVEGAAFIHAYEGQGVLVSQIVPQWRRKIAGVFAFPASRG